MSTRRVTETSLHGIEGTILHRDWECDGRDAPCVVVVAAIFAVVVILGTERPWVSSTINRVVASMENAGARILEPTLVAWTATLWAEEPVVDGGQAQRYVGGCGAHDDWDVHYALSTLDLLIPWLI